MNPLPASLDWIGWLATGILVAAWFFYRRKLRKGMRTESGLVGPIPIEGFADCHYPKGLDEWESKLLTLVDVRNNVMRICAGVYDCRQRWIVPKVTLIWDEPREDHPNVMWSRAGDRIVLKIQDDMYWHFAGEVHNVFRFGLHGPGSDRRTVDNADALMAAKVQAIIAEAYKGG